MALNHVTHPKKKSSAAVIFFQVGVSKSLYQGTENFSTVDKRKICELASIIFCGRESFPASRQPNLLSKQVIPDAITKSEIE